MGPMGCGKTTLATAFAEAGAEMCYEKVEQNPYLGKFYSNPPRFAFEKDMFFLMDFMHQAKTSNQDTTPTVFDYSMWGSEAYIEAGPQTAATKDICRAAAKAAITEIGHAAVVIYLNCSAATLAERIAARARSIEDAIPVEYLQKLKIEMDCQIAQAEKSCKVLTIDVEAVDLRDPAVSRAFVQKALSLSGHGLKI